MDGTQTSTMEKTPALCQTDIPLTSARVTDGEPHSITECEERVPDIPSSTRKITVCCYMFLITSLKNKVYHSGVIISRSTMTRR